MQIAICLFKYFPFGGMQRKCERIIDTLMTRGHQVRIYTLSWQAEPPPDGAELVVFPRMGKTNHETYRHFEQAVRTDVIAHPVDLLVGFNKIIGLDLYYAADPCYLARKKTGPFRWLQKLSSRYREFVSVESSLFKKGGNCHIAYLSTQQKQDFQSCYGTESERFHLLPPGLTPVELYAESHESIRQKIRLSLGLQDQKMILFVGSDFKRKGLDRALSAIKHLPNSVLVIVGNDSPRRYWRKIFKERLHTKIIFLGARKEVGELMVAADCLLHPARREAGGTVLVEALQYHLPVITTDVCGFAHYITDAHMGKVLPTPYQPSECVSALKTVLSIQDKSEWQKRSAKYLATHELFNLPEVFADIVENLAAQKLRETKANDMCNRQRICEPV